MSRAIQKHWIYSDSQYFHAWAHILFESRYSRETTKVMVEGSLVEIGYGQFVFGRIRWSKELGITEQRLRTLFTKLIKENMIELVQKYPKCTVYQVVNYAKYNMPNSNQQTNQQDNQHINQQTNHQQTLVYQGVSGLDNQHINQQDNHQPNHDINHHLTSSQPAANQQLTTEEERKKEKEKKGQKKDTTPFPHRFDEFWSKYPKKVSKTDAVKAWNKLIKQAANLDDVLSAVDNYIADIEHRGTAKEYIKYPASFLNDERWKDYLSISIPQSPKDKHMTFEDILEEARNGIGAGG